MFRVRFALATLAYEKPSIQYALQCDVAWISGFIYMYVITQVIILLHV